MARFETKVPEPVASEVVVTLSPAEADCLYELIHLAGVSLEDEPISIAGYRFNEEAVHGLIETFKDHLLEELTASEGYEIFYG